MLSSLISNLATYFSKYFLVASYLPTLIFVLLNSVCSYLAFEAFHDWVDEQLGAADGIAKSLFGTTVFALITLALAYTLSTLIDPMRRVLEGRWPRWLARFFYPLQELRRLHIEAARGEAAKAQANMAEVDQWEEALIGARTNGGETKLALVDGEAYRGLVRMLEKGEVLRSQNRIIPHGQLAAIFAALRIQLSNHDALQPCGGRLLLDGLHARFIRLLDYTRRFAPAEHMRLLTELQSSFGTNLAPTSMGNVANAMETYAERRYNCNLALFWSNLQFAIPKDARALATLEDAKAKLDFMVGSAWLTLLSAFVWVAVLGASSDRLYWFLCAGIGGPTLAYVWYRAAIEQYRAFADVVITSLDMYRLDILQILRVPAPVDAADERETWDTLHRLANYPEGENENFRYQSAKPLSAI